MVRVRLFCHSIGAAMRISKKQGFRSLQVILLLAGQNSAAGFDRRWMRTLAFEEVVPSPDKSYDSTAVVIHGLLGSGRNWRSFSRSLANALLPDQWRFVMVDLRNHGKSAEFVKDLPPPHDLEASANDLANLITSERWKWPDIVVGHSLGGKVALQFAQSCVNGDYGTNASLPKQIWILDSVPGRIRIDNNNGEVENVLQTLQTLPSTIPSRKWLVDHLLNLGYSKSLSEWLGTNIRKVEEDHYAWSFNLDGALQMFNSYRENDYWPLLQHTPKGTEIHVIRAEKSDRWTPDVIQQLQSIHRFGGGDENSGKTWIHVLPDAGHWVHVDNPKGLLQIMAPRLASLRL